MEIISSHIPSRVARHLRTPAIISLVLVLPFMILELINTRGFHSGFPIVLFVVMWLLPVSAILLSMPIVRNPLAGTGSLASRLGLLSRVVLAILIAWLWIDLIRDQMPCFLGVPNCD